MRSQKIYKTTLPTDVDEDAQKGVKMSDLLENNVETILQKVLTNPQMIDASHFAENQNGYGMPNIGSFLKVNDGNIAVIGLGLVMSSSIGGMLMRFVPQLGKWTTIMAGVILMYFGKTKKVIRDLGVGVLLGGLAGIFSGLGSQLGGIFSEKPMIYAETKETYGGGDGVYPENPDRRVFA